MARLPRYTESQSPILEELQAMRANAIRPSEAAAAAAAKYQAITSAANFGATAAAKIDEIRGKQELANAITSAEHQITLYDQEVEDKGFQLDEAGNVVYDIEEVRQSEQTVRRDIMNEQRRALKSASARAGYDTWSNEFNRQRNVDVAVYTFDRQRNIMKAEDEMRWTQQSNQGNFVGARETARISVGQGITDPTKLNDIINNINIQEDEAVLVRVLGNPDGASATELRLLDEALKTGEWPDVLGEESNVIDMDAKTRLAWQERIQSELDGMDRRATKDLKVDQQNNALEDLRGIVGGDLDQQDILMAPNARYDLTLRRSLMREFDEDLESDPHAKSRYYAELARMSGNPDLLGAQADILSAVLRDDQIVGADKLAIANQANHLATQVYGNPRLRQALDAELIRLQGMTEYQSRGGVNEDRRSEGIAGAEMARDFWASVEQQGMSEFDPGAWLKDNRKIYYDIALKDSLHGKNITLEDLPETQAEQMVYIADQVRGSFISSYGEDRWAGMGKSQQDAYINSKTTLVLDLVRRRNEADR